MSRFTDAELQRLERQWQRHNKRRAMWVKVGRFVLFVVACLMLGAWLWLAVNA